MMELLLGTKTLNICNYTDDRYLKKKKYVLKGMMKPLKRYVLKYMNLCQKQHMFLKNYQCSNRSEQSCKLIYNELNISFIFQE